MNREKADFKATVDVEFIEHDYGREMEGKKEAGVKEYSRVFDGQLDGWGVVVHQDREPWGEFPGGPVIRTLHFHCSGPGFNPWSGN